MNQINSVPLTQAAATLGLSYRATLDLVLRRRLRGHQDCNRHWWVDSDDLTREVGERAARELVSPT